MQKQDHFDLDSERHRVDPKKPGPSFTLCGQEFQCLPALPAGVKQRIASAVRLDSKGRMAFDAPNVLAFIEEAMIERRWIVWEFEGEDAASDLTDDQKKSVTDEGGYWETADDRTRFLAIMDSTEDIIELKDVAALMTFLMEWYGERPTRRSKR